MADDRSPRHLRAPRPAGSHRAVVVASRAEVRRRELKRELLLATRDLVLALLAHAALVWWLASDPVDGVAPPERQLILAKLEVVDEPEAPEDEPPSPELEEPEIDVVPETVELPPSETFLDDVPPGAADVLGLGGQGLGGLGAGGGRRAPENGDPLAALGVDRSAFRDFVEDLRRRGLDVVFVVDATGSMQRFIDRARETIADIMADLSGVVPNLRMGMVAYRDLDDDWVTRAADLTDDDFRIRNFLLDLTASGGWRGTADSDEAVEEGLRVATEELSWRRGARRVILVVGDAAYHPEDRARALTTVRRFASGRHSLVNTMIVGNVAPTKRGLRVREEFAQIAKSGDGVYFELVTDDEGSDEQLRRQVSEATFGPEWSRDVAALLESQPVDLRAESVRRRVERGDRRWLARRLATPPVHPEIVDGCVALFDKRIAVVCVEVLADEGRPETLRSACLYVLKRGMDVPAFDVGATVASQQDVLERIRADVAALPDAVDPPAPPR